MLKIIDTFCDFISYYDNCSNKTLDEKINSWVDIYMKNYSELRDKCINEYENDSFNWREIAREKVFPKIDENIDKIKTAHENILHNINNIIKNFENFFELNIDINIVIYVGIGNGAGWVCYYDGKPAVLFGLENIADLNWTDDNSIIDLISHELCHVAHEALRGKDNGIVGFGDKLNNNRDKALWNLYEEGFAERYESFLSENRTSRKGEEWITWCKNNKSKLCNIFLSYVNENKLTREFWGSWYNIEGYIETGYFLGREFIKDLEATRSFKEIALLNFDDIKPLAVDYLSRNSFWYKTWSKDKADDFDKYINLDYHHEFIDIFNKHNVKNVCDAACGFGKYSCILSKNNFDVSGFDLTYESIEISKEMLNKHCLSYDEFKVCSITDIDYQDNSFDGTVAHSVIDHLTYNDAQKAISELSRITKDTGIIYISFDGLEEDDETLPHIVLEDGSFKYTDGDRKGMIFKHYKDEEIRELIKGYDIILFKTIENGERQIIFRNTI